MLYQTYTLLYEYILLVTICYTLNVYLGLSNKIDPLEGGGGLESRQVRHCLKIS